MSRPRHILRVAVIGAGIGGLTTALSLAQIGTEVDVFEAAGEVRGLGVGINLLPHATRELDALGLLYGQMGRWQDAAKALARCLEEDPTYPRARYNRALALAKAGDTTAALDELERAAEDPASHAEAVRTLVDLSRQVHDKARLERWVVEAARIDRDAARDPGARELLDR